LVPLISKEREPRENGRVEVSEEKDIFLGDRNGFA